MSTAQRVRAVLLTPSGGVLVIRRVRLDGRRYRVLPGGAVEPQDTDLHAALRREVFEETGGGAQVLGRLPVVDPEQPSHRFYLARIASWSEADRTGPEFADPTRGAYLLEELAPTFAALDELPLYPEAVAELLRAAVGTDAGFAGLVELVVGRGADGSTESGDA